MEKQNKPRIRRKHIAIGALAAALLLAAGISGASAKYTKDLGDGDVIVRAKEFYFSSNLLVEGGTRHELNPGTESITFELWNHDDLLRVSEDPVIYSVTVNNNAMVRPSSGVLQKDSITSSKHSITLSNLQPGQTYEVEAYGYSYNTEIDEETGEEIITPSYEKIISATFVVLTENEGVFKYLESDPSDSAVLLTVWTENVSGDVTVFFPDGLIPDVTDEKLKNIGNYENGTYDGNKAAEGEEAEAAYTIGTLGDYSSYTYRFFKEDANASFSANDFDVIVDGNPAVVRTPE